MTSRSKETYNKQVEDFIKDVLVVCPSCAGQAKVKKPELGDNNLAAGEIKVTCLGCGFNKRLEDKPSAILYSTSSKTIPGKYLIIGRAIDPYFHLPLWLSITCCDNELWAYNLEHLNFLRDHVDAKLRERNTHDMANKSIGSRLPKWMTASKNRDAVLKAIAQLKLKK